MIEKLKINTIYEDFVRNVKLTEEQIKILDMMIDKEKAIKISMTLGISERTAHYEIKKIKNIYEDYCDLQLAKTILLFK